MGEVILVTGSSGFIGSRMVETLLSRGKSVRVLLRPESKEAESGAQRDGVEVCRVAYSDAGALGNAVSGVSSIIHLAGVTKALNEAGFDEGNVMPVKKLLEAVGRYNPSLDRFLLVSSLAAAGPASSPTPGVRESDQPHPVSAYGRSKLRGEQAAVRYAGSVPVTIVRPPAVYGAGDRDILQVFAMMKKGYLLSAGSGNRQRFSMIHVDDLINGILMALYSEKGAGETFFITSSRAYGWDEVIDAAKPRLGFNRLRRIDLPKPLVYALGMVLGGVARLTGKPALINRDKANELVQDYWVCSPEKARKEIGFIAQTPLREGIAVTIRWYKQKKWL